MLDLFKAYTFRHIGRGGRHYYINGIGDLWERWDAPQPYNGELVARKNEFLRWQDVVKPWEMGGMVVSPELVISHAIRLEDGRSFLLDTTHYVPRGDASEAERIASMLLNHRRSSDAVTPWELSVAVTDGRGECTIQIPFQVWDGIGEPPIVARKVLTLLMIEGYSHILKDHRPIKLLNDVCTLAAT